MIDHKKKEINLDYNYKITTGMILMLMQGKKLHFQMTPDAPRFTFYPPDEGVFISRQQYEALKRSSSSIQDGIFYEIEND